jgi:phage terminase large subunit GpA-like protein
MVVWAQEHYVLPRETAQIHGRWSPDYVPFWLEPMKWWSGGSMRQLNAAACTQAGKTEFANIALGYAADVDAGPFLVVLPTQDVATQRLATRIRPMFRSCPRLMKKIGNDLANFNIGKETIMDDMILYIAWANSAITLSDRPIRYVVFDEPTKYPSSVGTDTDPISLGKRRQRGFTLNAKTYCCSSPVLEDDLFWKEWEKGDPYDWHVPCPKCGRWHQMAWERVELDKDDQGRLLDPKEYTRGGHARYVCPHCKGRWTEYQRWQAVEAGQWVQAGAHVVQDGRIEGGRPAGPVRSIRIWAGMLHPIFQTMDGLAAEWAAAQLAKRQGNVKILQDFINNQLAGPWRETAKATPVEQLRTHIDPKYPTGGVPQQVLFTTRGIDVQLDHFYVAEVAWGDLSECWVTFYARIDTGDTQQLANWGPLEDYLKSGTPLAEDPSRRAHPAMTSIDCAYHTEEAIAFCRQCQRQGIPIIPSRGSEHMRRGIMQPFKDCSKQILRYDFNEDYYKGILHSMLFLAAEPGPGYMHLPADTTDEFLDHLTSEEAREIPVRGRRITIWVNKGGGANHWWDCLVHARNAAEKVGVRWLDPRATAGPKPEGRPVGRKPIRTRY